MAKTPSRASYSRNIDSSVLSGGQTMYLQVI